VFAVVFDHLSVTERKNPVGVIEAFRRAFALGEGPLLVVKTMNARQRWPQHQRVQLAAEGRDDIIKRVGRSPDRASAVILAAMDTPKVRALRHLDREAGLESSLDYDPYARI
jgi:hypothetical protein